MWGSGGERKENDEGKQEKGIPWFFFHGHTSLAAQATKWICESPRFPGDSLLFFLSPPPIQLSTQIPCSSNQMNLWFISLFKWLLTLLSLTTTNKIKLPLHHSWKIILFLHKPMNSFVFQVPYKSLDAFPSIASFASASAIFCCTRHHCRRFKVESHHAELSPLLNCLIFIILSSYLLFSIEIHL